MISHMSRTRNLAIEKRHEVGKTVEMGSEHVSSWSEVEIEWLGEYIALDPFKDS